jgi:hypothetical protein
MQHFDGCAVPPDSLCSASCPRPPRELRPLRPGQPAAIYVCTRRLHLGPRRTSVGTDARKRVPAGRNGGGVLSAAWCARV